MNLPARLEQAKARLLDRVFGSECPPNLEYGHARILRQYPGVWLPYRVPGDLQHGWMPGYDESLRPLLDSGLRDVHQFVWSSANLKASLEMGFSRVTAIGAPLLYLSTGVQKPADEKSLVVFPFHTWERSSYDGDAVEIHKEYLESVLRISESFSSITVCLYWLQFASVEIRNVFLNKGLRVVTLGPRDGNPQFLWRFRNLVLGHEYVSSNHYSTAVF